MNIPAHLHYTKNHEWFSLEGDIATIGITDFAQRELGDIVFLDIPTQEQKMKQDDILGTIEAVKTVSDIFSPLDGRVIEINSALEKNPEKINADPYGQGWIMKIKIDTESLKENFLSAGEYTKLIGA